jgi:opacity protein-like surface antigen
MTAHRAPAQAQSIKKVELMLKPGFQTTKNVARALMLVLLCVFSIGAQEKAKPKAAEEVSEPFYKRVSFGLRGGSIIGGLENEQTSVTATTSVDPAIKETTYTNRGSAGYTVGPTIQVKLRENIGLNVDFLYKRFGYDAGMDGTTQKEDEDGEYTVWGWKEKTRATYWDIPVLARYYWNATEEGGLRAFFTGGPTFRSVSGIETNSETVKAHKTDDDQLSDTSSVPISANKKSLIGATVGFGLQLRDDVGFKIEFETRFTRWSGRTFDRTGVGGLTLANSNQVEVLLGFTF